MQFVPAILFISFLASFIRSAFGFGEALVAVPLLALLLPLSVAVPLALMLSVTIALLILVQDHQHIHLKEARGLILSALPGIPLGLYLMLQLEERWTKLLLGLFIAAFSLYSLLKPQGKIKPTKPEKKPLLLLLAGFISGVLGGAYGLNGPPLVFYGDRAGWNATRFRATLQAYFLPASSIALFCFFTKSLVTREVCYDYLIALPAAIPAIYIGRWLNAKLPTGLFFKVVYLLLLAIGIMLFLFSLTGRSA